MIKINLGSDGIASLISTALLRNVKDGDEKVLGLRENIPLVLKKLPYFLAEFKTGVCPSFIAIPHPRPSHSNRPEISFETIWYRILIGLIQIR